MEYLSVKEYAQLRGCTERYVRQLIDCQKIEAVEVYGGKGGKDGKRWSIPLASIEPKLIRKYNRLHPKQQDPTEEEPQEDKIIDISIEQLTADERKEVELWKEILNNWRSYRNGCKNKVEADRNYLEFASLTYQEVKINNVRTLYRKWKTLNEQGETALIDKRGKHENHHKAMPDEVFNIFEDFYLDESQPTVESCVELTELQLKKDGKTQYLPLPSYRTFARYIDRIPVPVLKYFRLGEKACKDQCGSYISRFYNDLYSNDIWVCDNHTFDIFISRDEEPVRVYLTAFEDIRSREITGWYVTNSPSSDATIYALRRGIERCGIPKQIYSDNGREFLTHDIGGRGFRKTAQTDEHEPMTILKRLDIEFKTALVRNAKAKIIERRFLDVKNTFSKMFEAYTGGNVLERPERLKHIVKNPDNLVVLEDFREFVDTYIMGKLNKKSSKGKGMNGKCPDEVFAENLIEQRVASKAELNLMLMRNGKIQKVKRNGVMFKLYDMELWYGCDELVMHHIGESVYFRYNPDDLSSVRIYDTEDRFIMEAPLRNELSYKATKEEVAREMKASRTLIKTVKAYKKNKDIQNDSALSLILEEAARKMEESPLVLDPKKIIPIRAINEEKPEMMAVAAGDGTMEEIDWSAAIERLRKAKENSR